MAPMSAGSVRRLSTEGGYFRLLYDSQAVCAPSATPVVRNPTATAITDPSTTINRFFPAVIAHLLAASSTLGAVAASQKSNCAPIFIYRADAILVGVSHAPPGTNELLKARTVSEFVRL